MRKFDNNTNRGPKIKLLKTISFKRNHFQPFSSIKLTSMLSISHQRLDFDLKNSQHQSRLMPDQNVIGIQRCSVILQCRIYIQRYFNWKLLVCSWKVHENCNQFAIFAVKGEFSPINSSKNPTQPYFYSISSFKSLINTFPNWKPQNEKSFSSQSRIIIQSN